MSFSIADLMDANSGAERNQNGSVDDDNSFIPSADFFEESLINGETDETDTPESVEQSKMTIDDTLQANLNTNDKKEPTEESFMSTESLLPQNGVQRANDTLTPITLQNSTSSAVVPQSVPESSKNDSFTPYVPVHRPPSGAKQNPPPVASRTSSVANDVKLPESPSKLQSNIKPTVGTAHANQDNVMLKQASQEPRYRRPTIGNPKSASLNASNPHLTVNDSNVIQQTTSPVVASESDKTLANVK